MALADPPTFLRSSTRIYPRPDQQPGLVEQDVDGDGRMLTMRDRRPERRRGRSIPTTRGCWCPARSTRTGPATTTGCCPRESSTSTTACSSRSRREHRSLDLNRNFPQEWLPEGAQHGAGPFPTSEPEVRALVEAVVARPNICALHRVPHVQRRDPASVRRLRGRTLPHRGPAARTRRSAGAATEITGYEAVSVFHDFKYDPKTSITGASDEWTYDHLGIFGWTTEFWSPIRAAGITDFKYIDWFDEHPVEDDLRLLRWNDEVLDGDGLRRLVPVRPPAARPGRDRRLGLLPHLDERAAVAHGRRGRAAQRVGGRAPARVAAARGALARPPTRSATASGGCGSSSRTPGWLPTNVSKKALERKAVRPVEAEIELPDGASLALGDAAPGARASSRATAGPDRCSRCSTAASTRPTTGPRPSGSCTPPPGTTVRVTARHARAGTVPRRGHPRHSDARTVGRVTAWGRGGGGAVGPQRPRADARGGARDAARRRVVAHRERRPSSSRAEHDVPAFAVVRRAARRLRRRRDRGAAGRAAGARGAGRARGQGAPAREAARARRRRRRARSRPRSPTRASAR